MYPCKNKKNWFRKSMLGAGLLVTSALGINPIAEAQVSGTRTNQSSRTRPVLPADLDQYVDQVLRTFNVPGMAISVVKRDQILLTKGYGVKDMDSKSPVDEHTLFPIASNSKAFTGTALALLVQEGKIKWNDPVVKHLPWFKLSNPYVTSELTIEDLLVHRSGIAPYAGDLLQFPPSTYTRKELVQRLQYLPLATSFRSTYAYDNVLYLVAGLLIQEVSGMEWEAYVKQNIFKPVGMDGSISRFSEFQHASNIALSHAPVAGKVQRLYNFFELGFGDVSGPAGGVVSNASDMAKWVQFQLDSGINTGGQQILSKNLTANLWKGVTPMNVAKAPEWLAPAQQDLSSYALGFRIYTYRGMKAVTHGGKLDGYVSYVIFFPNLDLGISILTNQECNNAYNAVINHIVDHVMGVPEFDWIKGYRMAEDLKFANIAKQDASTTENRNSKIGPSLSLEHYVGNYHDAWYGDISIKKEERGYVMRFEHSPKLVGVLSHWQYDTFLVTWDAKEMRADAFITFSLDHQGKIKSASMKAVSPATDVSYDFHDLHILPGVAGQ